METLNQFAKAKKPLHFMAFLEKLVAQFKPLQVYQYAQLGQQWQTESVFCNPQQKEEEIYYLLIVTEGSTRIENGIQDFANQHYPEGKVVVLAHGQATLKQSPRMCNDFFNAVQHRGLILYSADGILQSTAVETFNLQSHLDRAQSNWRHRYNMANGFLKAADTAFDNGFYNVCVFLLHQVVEQFCIGMIWVFMGYRSDMHNLRRLLYLCACFSKQPLKHFTATPENDSLLTLMMESYSCARYKNDYTVLDTHADKLYSLVYDFVQLSKELCKNKLMEFEAAVAVVKEKEVAND